jgi:hypothetical protein
MYDMVEVRRTTFENAMLDEKLWSRVGTSQEDWRGFFHRLCRTERSCYHALASLVNRLVRATFPLLTWSDLQEWIEEGDRQLVWKRVSMMLPKHFSWARKSKAKKKKQRDRQKEKKLLFAIASLFGTAIYGL